MTPEQMDKNVAKTWAEFELLSDNSEVDLRMDPVTTQPAKKNILSYLLPRSGGEANKRLKVDLYTRIHHRHLSGVMPTNWEDSILMKPSQAR